MTLDSEMRIERGTSAPPNTTPRNAAVPPKSLMALVTAYAQRIYQDLVAEGFDHEYHSVRRFVAKLQGTSPLPFRRMECAMGEEAQIDFGTGAWIELPDGKRRRSHVFRIVLSG
jgi:hypothetical protein